MKKVIGLFLTMFLIGQVVTPIHASTMSSSITNYGEGNEIYGNCKVQQVALSDSLQGLMMATEDGLVLSNNESFKIKTNYPVKDFVVIDDIDQDGIKDVAVFLDVKDGYDNFAIMTSKESKEVYKSKFIHQGADETGNVSEKNSSIRQMLYSEGLIYILYDYHIVAINAKTYQQDFDYQEKDNIWKMAVVEDKVMYTNQLGTVGAIDKASGKKVFSTPITSPMHPSLPYEKKTSEVVMSTWDIVFVKDTVYVTSEEGYVLQIDKDSGEIVNTLHLDGISVEDIEKSLSTYYGYDSTSRKQIVYPTGPFSYSFMGYKIRMIKEDIAIIEAYLGDEAYQVVAGTDQGNGKRLPAMLFVVNLKEMKVKTKISLEQYSMLAANAVLGSYEGKEAILVPSSVSKGSIKVLAYDLEDGKLLGQRTVKDSNIPLDNAKIMIDNYDDQYVLRIAGATVISLSNDLKSTMPLHHSINATVISNVADGTIVSYQKDGKVTEIKKLGLQGKQDIQVSMELPNSYSSSQGFEAIHYDENKNHMLSLVNEVNDKNEVIASHIVIMDMVTGSIVHDKKVLLDKGYDEHNKYYENYLIGEKIEYFADLNGDGKEEILVDESIIDGATLTFKSMYSQSVEENGTILSIGDINKDGIHDIVSVGDSQMRVYYSSKDGYDISYKKTDIIKKYDKGLQNQSHAKILGDLDHDGIQEIIVNAKNDAGYQYYQVLNGKDLSVRFNLLEDGVFDWGESFSLLHQDINHDGIEDIYYSSPEDINMVLSGKDGKSILEYTARNYENYNNSVSEPPLLDSIVEINLVENQGNIIMLDDYDGDGNQDIGYMTIDYQNNPTKYYLVITSSKTMEIIEKVEIASFNDGIDHASLIPVYNQSKIIYRQVQEDGYSQIFDYKNKELIAGYKMDIAYARGLDNGEIQIQNAQQQIYSIGDGKDFTIVGLEDNASINGNLKFTYESNKSGIMEVYDQGKLVARTTDTTLPVKLLPGKHTLIFSYDDGHGKVTHQTRQIQVSKGSLLRYVTMLLSLLLVITGGLYTFYPKYKLLKKAGVSRG